MLVLSRRIGESLVIDGHIVVTVVAQQGNKIQLGVAAPRTTPVHRKEVQDEIDRKKGVANVAQHSAKAAG